MMILIAAASCFGAGEIRKSQHFSANDIRNNVIPGIPKGKKHIFFLI